MTKHKQTQLTNNQNIVRESDEINSDEKIPRQNIHSQNIRKIHNTLSLSSPSKLLFKEIDKRKAIARHAENEAGLVLGPQVEERLTRRKRKPLFLAMPRIRGRRVARSQELGARSQEMNQEQEPRSFKHRCYHHYYQQQHNS